MPDRFGAERLVLVALSQLPALATVGADNREVRCARDASVQFRIPLHVDYQVRSCAARPALAVRTGHEWSRS